MPIGQVIVSHLFCSNLQRDSAAKPGGAASLRPAGRSLTIEAQESA